MALVPAIQSDRLRRAFLSLVNAVAPQLLYLGQYEARVVSSSAPAAVQSQLGGLTWVVSAVFSDAAIAKVLPPLANITVWPGPVWGYSQPVPGSLVRIAFVNGDPSKPAIVGFDPSVPPTSVSIGAPTATPAALGVPVGEGFLALGTFATNMAAAGTPPPTTLAQVITAIAGQTAAASALVSPMGTAAFAAPALVVKVQ